MLRRVGLGLLFGLFIGAPGAWSANPAAAEAWPLPLPNLSSEVTVYMEKGPGDYSLVLENAMPGASYALAVGSTYKPLPPPAPPTPSVQPPPGTPPVTPACPILDRYRNSVEGATSEEEVATTNLQYLAEVQVVAPGCVRDMEKLIEKLTTRPTGVEATIRKKFVTEILVSRVAAGGEERDWELEVTTGPGAVWLTMPVLALVNDEGQEWFADSAPLVNEDGSTEERYRLIREDEGLDLRPGAGVGFFLVPEKQRQSNLAWHYMAGLGLSDSATPLVFMVGGGMTFGDHVTLDLGMAATWERELLGRYRDVEFIDDNLTGDQLTKEELVVRPFFSMGIDFSGFDITASGKNKRPSQKSE